MPMYIDDHFPQHPKVIEAGGDAAWLWVCALGWVRFNKTAGRIPKAMVPRISDRRTPMKLAERLVKVGLWIDEGEHYLFHQYDEHNYTEARRRRAAQNAANARWEKEREQAERNADAMRTHMPTHCDSDAERDALDDASALDSHADSHAPPRARARPHPHPHPQLDSSPIPSSGLASAAAGRDGDETPPTNGLATLAERVAHACRGTNRHLVTNEAQSVVAFLARYVDTRLIEQAATRAEAKGAKLPRYLLSAVRADAAAHGITIPRHPQLENGTDISPTLRPVRPACANPDCANGMGLDGGVASPCPDCNGDAA